MMLFWKSALDKASSSRERMEWSRGIGSVSELTEAMRARDLGAVILTSAANRRLSYDIAAVRLIERSEKSRSVGKCRKR